MQAPSWTPPARRQDKNARSRWRCWVVKFTVKRACAWYTAQIYIYIILYKYINFILRTLPWRRTERRDAWWRIQRDSVRFRSQPPPLYYASVVGSEAATRGTGRAAGKTFSRRGLAQSRNGRTTYAHARDFLASKPFTYNVGTRFFHKHIIIIYRPRSLPRIVLCSFEISNIIYCDILNMMFQHNFPTI